jgi:hypothetical protein
MPSGWTELNFCRVFIRRKRLMARSRRRNGRWEFSTLLFFHRPVSCRSALPIITAATTVGTNLKTSFTSVGTTIR